MNPRTTGLLLVVAAALGAFIYFYEIRGGAQRSDAEAATKRLFPGLEAAELSHIELDTSDGQSARLERRDGAWRLVAPVDFAADETVVEGLATTLAQLTREAKLDDPQPPEVYGLGPEGEGVRFSAAGADHRLRLGIETPVGDNAYVMAEGSDQVSIVPSWRVDSLRRSLDALRDARLLHFDRTALVAMTVRWADGFAKLEKREDGWWLAEPVAELADREAVDALLSDLSFLQAEGFLDGPASDAELGLDPPDYRVELTSSADESAPSGAVLSIAAAGEDGFRLARGSELSLYRISDGRVASLPRQLLDFRFKQLSRFDPEQVQRVELDFAATDDSEQSQVAATRVALTRSEDGWRAAEGDADSDKIAVFVAALGSLDASEILADAMGSQELAALGLEPPRVTVRVFAIQPAADATAADAPLVEVQLGVRDASKGVVARLPQREVVYRIGGELAEQLPLDLAAYHQRFAP